MNRARTASTNISLLLLLALAFALPSFAQNVRWDSVASTTAGAGQLVPIQAMPGAHISFFSCTSTLNCTTPATTYQSATDTVGCPAGTQVVWPISVGCVATADSKGNFGGWFQPGLYQYFVTSSTLRYGPYFFSIASSGGTSNFLSLAGGTLYGALFAPDINGEIYPASCGYSTAPSWCTGTTADAWIRAACAQLPSSGGFINLRGLTGTIAASVPCSTPTKQVIILEDPSSPLTITENDGGTVFPIDNASSFLGPGAGQCTNAGGIHLSASANVASIVGPAHTDGTQENFTANGLCLYGAAGATVSQGLIYTNRNFTNTTISNNVVSVCPGACIKVVNGDGQQLINNWANVQDGVNSITGIPLIIQGIGLGNGCNVIGTNVSGGQYEHALGGAAEPEILVKGDGTGLVLACDIHVHDLGVERSPGGTPSTIGISVSDCKNCSFENIVATGQSGGTSVIELISNYSNSIANVVLRNISNIFGDFTNTLQDTTTNGITIPFSVQPFITTYYSNPGYVQPPVLPGTTLQSLGTDFMGGAGSFATGNSSFGTGFGATGCNISVSCTYTRTNSTAPTGYTYSQQIQITANTDSSAGFNGVQYNTLVSFTAGQSYVATFWAKGDGTFAGLPTFLLWNSVTPVTYCQGTSSSTFTTTWTLYSFICTPATSGSDYLAITAETPSGAMGTFYFGGFTFAPVQALSPPGSILASVGPYGVAPAPGVLYSAAVNPLPSCATGNKGAILVVSDATSPTYAGTYTSGGAVTVPVVCNGSAWVTH